MYRKFLLASVGAIALTGSAAFAAEPPPPYIPPPPVFTWTGPYVGGQIGYAWGTGNFNTTLFDPITGTFFNASAGGTPSGVIGGAHVGFQYEINQWVLGIEGSVDGTGLHNSAFVAFPAAFGNRILTASTSVDVEGTIRGKIGFAWDRVLIYGTGGVAFGGSSTDLSLTAVTAAGAPFAVTSNVGNNRVGWTAGGGLQYAVTNNWWVFTEYRYTNFGDINISSGLLSSALPTGVFFRGSRQIRQNQVQAGFSYRFDLAPPVPVVAKY
jgi:outer membrane immunogenic protein